MLMPLRRFDRSIHSRLALVKELIENDPQLSHKVAEELLRDLKKMRKTGIYPMDVRARNNRAGLLVNMSLTMITPHSLNMTSSPAVPTAHVSTINILELRDLLTPCNASPVSVGILRS